MIEPLLTRSFFKLCKQTSFHGPLKNYKREFFYFEQVTRSGVLLSPKVHSNNNQTRGLLRPTEAGACNDAGAKC